MMEGWLIMLGGLLGSSHCIGMCGGFALNIGAGARHWTDNLRRQLIYSLGRIFTYASIGAIAGYAGLRLAQFVSPLVNVQATLAILAGCLLAFQGLKSLGWVRWPRFGSSTVGCLATRFFAPFLSARNWSQVFLAGMLTGLLPCGLVYAYLALAASTGSMLRGLACMAFFGAGTVPAMVLIGCGSSLVSLTMRRYVFRVAAWCVLLTGVLSIYRGAGSLRTYDSEASCPFCREAAATSHLPAPGASFVERK
jgi:sulfite exporter TauE/SafE